jgi:multiple sugar transport system ATP-binding protein
LSSVAVSGLRKKFGKTQAVAGVTIRADAGQFVVLLGPSGSGKTTLLRCIAGLEKPEEGLVTIGEEVVNDLPAAERDVSMVFQSYGLFPLMSARENIAFPLKVRHKPPDEVHASVQAVAEKLGIVSLLDKLPRQLSGGEQQRVAIARAIVRPTKALLMDEPLSSLDAPLRVQLRAELKAIQRQIGATIVYVTHDQVEAMTLADMIGVLQGGRLVQFGPPETVYNRPATVFVARFVGSPGANILEATVRRDDKGVYLSGDGFRLEAGAKTRANALKPGREVYLGIRPETVRVSENEVPGSFECTVEMVEPLGANTILLARAGYSKLKMVVPPDLEVNPGARVWATADPDRLLLFDKETEELLQ